MDEAYFVPKAYEMNEKHADKNDYKDDEQGSNLDEKDKGIEKTRKTENTFERKINKYLE